MKIVKRGGIAIFSLAIMLMVAGYVNYKYDSKREENLGKTIYVNGKDSFTYENVSIYDENKNESSISTESENLEIQKSDSNSNNDNTIAAFRYDRDNMYSELVENYKDAIQNGNVSQERINEYQSKIDKIIEEKNLINMVENVILSKGVEDVAIIPTNDNNINVIIKSKEKISETSISKIKQIIIEQLGIDSKKISIECKN